MLKPRTFKEFLTRLKNFSIVEESFVDNGESKLYNKILNIRNTRCLVINDVALAQKIAERNKVICIYFNNDIPKEQLEGDAICEYVKLDVVDRHASDNMIEDIKSIVSKYNNKSFDYIISVGLKPGESGMDYLGVSYFNYELLTAGAFEAGITSFISIDDMDVYVSFDKEVEKRYGSDESQKGSHVHMIGKIECGIWEGLYGSSFFISEHELVEPKENLDKSDSGPVGENGDIIYGETADPVIYAFETDIMNSILPDDETALKVGDTNRDIDVRMKEWGKPGYYPGLVPKGHWSAVLDGFGPALDGKVFRDKSVHKFLVKKGFDNIKKFEVEGKVDMLGRPIYYSNEFFKNCTVKDVEDAINELKQAISDGKNSIIKKLKDLKKKEKNNVIMPSHHKPDMFTPRELQSQVIDNFEKRILETKPGEPVEMLMYAVMRFGKTFVACECVRSLCGKRKGGKFIMVTSAKVDVKNEWMEQVNPYKLYENIDMYDVEGLKKMLENKQPFERKNGKTYKDIQEYFQDFPEKNIMLFASLQDLNGSLDKKGMKENHKYFYNTPIDMLIIDEAHYGAQSQKYGRQTRQSLMGMLELMPMMTFKKDAVKLHLSGTPYKLINDGIFQKRDIIASFSFADLMDAKQKWIDDNMDKINTGEMKYSDNPYFGIPEMLQYGYNLDLFQLKKYKEDGLDYSLDRLFSVVNVEGKRVFQYEDDIYNLFAAIDGSQKNENVIEILDLPEVKEGKLCRHILAALPSKDSCDVMEEFLTKCKKETKDKDGNVRPALKNLGLYKVINVAGKEEGVEECEEVKRMIAKEDKANNKTITLTVDMMLTGVSVREWDCMFYMKDGKSAQAYDQAKFRIQTPYKKKALVFDIGDDLSSVDIALDEKGDPDYEVIDNKRQTVFVDFSAKRIYELTSERYHAQLRADAAAGKKIYEPVLDKDGNPVLDENGKPKTVEIPVDEANSSAYIKYMAKREKPYLPILVSELGSKKLKRQESNNIMDEFAKYFAKDFENMTPEELLSKQKWYVPSEDMFAKMAGMPDTYERKGGHSYIKKQVFGDEENQDSVNNTTPSEETYTDDGSGSSPTSKPAPKQSLTMEEKIAKIKKYYTQCDTLMRNIYIYLVTRLDNYTIHDFHDLCHDSMRKENTQNYDIIVSIFTDKNPYEMSFDQKQKIVDEVRNTIQEWVDLYLKKDPEHKLLETIQNKIVAMSYKYGEDRKDYEKIKSVLKDFTRGKISDTEIIGDDDTLAEKLFENVVIFNKGEKILDCYGSKVGEYAWYLANKWKHKDKFSIDNYYIVCRKGMIAELCKVPMLILARKEGILGYKNLKGINDWLNDHILVFDPLNEKNVVTVPSKTENQEENAVTTSSENSKVEMDYNKFETFSEFMKLINEGVDPDAERKEKKEASVYERKGGLYKLKKAIENKWKGMTWNIVVGNPPYGDREHGGGMNLHLQIMKTVLDLCTDKLTFIMPSKPIIKQLEDPWYSMLVNAVCTNITVVSKNMFPNTTMENTAIYYCDRTIPEDQIEDSYDKKLDVDDRIYDILPDTGKLFVDKMSKMSSLNIFSTYKLSKRNEESILNGIKKKIDNNNTKYYLNVSRSGIKPGDGAQIWFSGTLEKESVKTADEEKEFILTHRKTKNIIICPTKEYGENLKNLMINGKVLRYSLWLTQVKQDILQAQFKYVPDIDYTIIDTDEKLLSECGFTSDEIEKVMNYLKDFEFTQNRNDMVRNAVVKSEPDSSPSSSGSSKQVVDDEDEGFDDFVRDRGKEDEEG